MEEMGIFVYSPPASEKNQCILYIYNRGGSIGLLSENFPTNRLWASNNHILTDSGGKSHGNFSLCWGENGTLPPPKKKTIRNLPSLKLT